MSQTKSFRLVSSGNDLMIEEVGFDFIGRVEVPSGSYRVLVDGGKVVAVVDKIEDAAPALVDYIKNQPHPWEQREPSTYMRRSDILSGELCVQQEPLGFWSVYRMQSEILLYDGRPAAFATAEEAMRVADTHAYDPAEEDFSDGYCWHEMDHDLVKVTH